MTDVRSRLAAKVVRVGTHDVWQGATNAAGVGQMRVDGRLTTARRVAWELAHGPLEEGQRVDGCPNDSRCVRASHLSVAGTVTAPGRERAARGSGSKREIRPGVWELSVTTGRDVDGKPTRSYRTIRGNSVEAARALALFVTEVADGRAGGHVEDKALTVDGLVEWYVDFARDVRGLEQSTLVGYRQIYKVWLGPAIGSTRANRLSDADLDRVFGSMRSAGLSHSMMNQAKALLSGAFKWGKRHGKVGRNPLNGFELPTSTASPRRTVAPELADLIQVLNGADEHDPELAPMLKLGAITGMRRGELCGLRRDRMRLERGEITVELAVSDAGGNVLEKSTKTKQRRIVSLDPATVAMLREHLVALDTRAALFGVEVAADAYVFSLDPSCAVPVRPEHITRRMRALRKALCLDGADFDATIIALRKWSSSELMDAGFNPSAVSTRQGHSVQVMLQHYSARRRSADEAAAAHLGALVHGGTSSHSG